MATVSTKKKFMIGVCALASFAFAGVVYAGSQVADNSIYHLNATTTKTFTVTFNSSNLPATSGTTSQTFTYQNNVYTIVGGYETGIGNICRHFTSPYSKNGYTELWTIKALYFPINTYFYWLNSSHSVIHTEKITTDTARTYDTASSFAYSAVADACYWELLTTDSNTGNNIRFESISFKYTCNA
jgi:hypothetical protein